VARDWEVMEGPYLSGLKRARARRASPAQSMNCDMAAPRVHPQNEHRAELEGALM
jgi:hypothetical protein